MKCSTRGFARLVGLIAAVLLVGCVYQASPRWPPPNPARARAACKAQGGYITGVGMFGAWACVVPFSDGGRQCRTKADCQGRCLVDLDAAGSDYLKSHPVGAAADGQCELTNQTFGCFGVIEEGKLVSEPCED